MEIGGNMGIIIGIIMAVGMILFVNYLIKNSDKKYVEPTEEKICVINNNTVVGTIFCKNCKHLCVLPNLTRREYQYVCKHPLCYKIVGIDVISGKEMLERTVPTDIHQEWNKNCNCANFETK